ncbi:MAG: flippase-like domain-containing protein [Clostridia bacterium]|nr:flippase-like domain-containing protein [Clostridia bacterium]
MADKENKSEQLHLEGTNPQFSDEQKIEMVEEQTELAMQIDENQTSINDFDDGILEGHVVAGLIKEAEETEQKSKKKKTAITSIIFFAINILLMIFIVRNLLNSASVANFNNVAQAQTTRLWWIAGGFGFLVLFFACETLLFYFLIKKITGKRRLWLSYRIAAVGKYYDFITPTQLGGQPSQILRLTKSGLSGGQATSIPIIKLIVYSFVYTVISIFLYFYGLPMVTTAGSLQGFLMALVKILGGIGLVVTVIMTFLYFIIGNGKLIGRSFITWLVRVGFKLHIVKNYRKALDRLMTQVQEYQSSIKYLNKNKGTLVITVLLCLVECVAFALIPFAMVMAFGSTTFSGVSDALFCMLVTMSSYYLCLMVSTIIPLPGGTGTMEVCFIFLFSIGTFSVGDNIGWALIFFRLITYYAVIAHGFLHIVFENIIRIAKSKKQGVNK